MQQAQRPLTKVRPFVLIHPFSISHNKLPSLLYSWLTKSAISAVEDGHLVWASPQAPDVHIEGSHI